MFICLGNRIKVRADIDVMAYRFLARLPRKPVLAQKTRFPVSRQYMADGSYRIGTVDLKRIEPRGIERAVPLGSYFHSNRSTGKSPERRACVLAVRGIHRALQILSDLPSADLDRKRAVRHIPVSAGVPCADGMRPVRQSRNFKLQCRCSGHVLEFRAVHCESRCFLDILQLQELVVHQINRTARAGQLAGDAVYRVGICPVYQPVIRVFRIGCLASVIPVNVHKDA